MKRTIVVIAVAAVLGCWLGSALFGQAYAGKGRMWGYVTDDAGKPVPGVTVKLYHVKSNSGFNTTTDANGRWEAMWIRSGTWYMDFSKLGYELRKLSTEVAETSKGSEIPVKLKKLEGLLLTPDLVTALEKANQLFEDKKYDEALAAYTQLLKENPDAYIINLSIGNCYFEKGDYDQAIEGYQKALEKNPQYTKAQLAIGKCYDNKKEPDKAIEWYNKVDIAKIDDPDVLYNIGIFYFNKNKNEAALPYLKKSIEVRPGFLDGLYQLALVYIGLNNNDEASKAFEEYLKLDPDSDRAKQQVKPLLDYLKTKK